MRNGHSGQGHGDCVPYGQRARCIDIHASVSLQRDLLTIGSTLLLRAVCLVRVEDPPLASGPLISSSLHVVFCFYLGSFKEVGVLHFHLLYI